MEDTAYLLNNAVSMQRNGSLRKHKNWELVLQWHIAANAKLSQCAIAVIVT